MCLTLRTIHLHIVAIGGAQSIGCVHKLAQCLFVKLQQSLQHAGNLLLLLLRGSTVAGYRHLDFHGRIFVDGHSVMYRSRNSCALGSS